MNTRIGMIGRWLLFLVALCGSGMVWAVTTPLGTLTPGVEKKDGAERAGASVPHFQDDFTFTLAGNGSVSVWIKDDRESSSRINNLNGSILVFASGAVPSGSNTTGTALDFTVTGLMKGVGIPPAPVYTVSAVKSTLLISSTDRARVDRFDLR